MSRFLPSYDAETNPLLPSLSHRIDIGSPSNGHSETINPAAQRTNRSPQTANPFNPFTWRTSTLRIVVPLILFVALWIGGLTWFFRVARVTPPKPPHPTILPVTTLPATMKTTTTTTVIAASAAESSAIPFGAIVIVTYNRPDYLERTLRQLLATSGVQNFSLFVSQDGGDPPLNALLDTFRNANAVNITLLNAPRHAVLPNQGGTAYLAQHYKWMLDTVLLQRNHSHAVLLEDDLLIAPDFLTLMRDTAPLLNDDPTVWCVSSWHDNGLNGLVADPHRLFRTDYFPGLGWMLTRKIWTELSPIFPPDQWDHFMRLDATHKGRSCIVPEISRNRNIGEAGTNMQNHFFQRYLQPVATQQEPVQSFLHSVEQLRQPHYDERLAAHLNRGTSLGWIDEPAVLQRLTELKKAPTVLAATSSDGRISVNEFDSDAAVFVVFYRRNQFDRISNMYGILAVPRSTHRGILTVRGADRSFIHFIDVRRFNGSGAMAAYKIPSAYEWRPHSHFHNVGGELDESCDSVCSRYHDPLLPTTEFHCADDHFVLSNSCYALQAVFGCSAGCVGGVSGFDVPNFVSSPNKPEFYQKCLTTEDNPTCGAKHWSAQRLCPCVPNV